MGTTTSKVKGASTQAHKQALASYHEREVQLMLERIELAAGSTSIRDGSVLTKLLNIHGKVKHLGQPLLAAILATAEESATNTATSKRSCSEARSVSAADVILFKYVLEQGSKDERAQLLRRLLQHSSKAHPTVENCIRELFIVSGFSPSSLAGPPTSAHLAALCAPVATSAADPTGDSTTLLRTLRSWPALLDIFSLLSASFPTPTTPPQLLPELSGISGIGRRAPVDTDKLLLPSLSRHALASLLPPAQRANWELLFNSDVHGKSFATFTGRVLNRGPTITVVRDKQGAVFGGFAAAPWSKSGTFYGSSTSFLFTLLPKFAVYFATGVNSNFQWCGVKFSELPNGIGFGGQVGYYSLLINSDLDSGMSRPAATYGAPCLASSQLFALDSVECWLVEEWEDESATGGTAMDRFEGDKFLLEMHGRAMHSDGYRGDEPIE